MDTRYADLAGTELVATSTFGYDSADRITSLDHDDSSSSTLAGYTWSYDEGNRLTAFTVYGYSTEDATYSYDDTDQLTGADRGGTSDDESYTYDENGNRTNTGYSTGDNNQLTSDGTYNYTYDDEGNRLTKTNISTGDYVEYTWDYRNRLTNITTKNSSDVITHEVDYTYDVFNRRIVKTIDADGAGSGTATEEVYIYDGLREERGAAGDHMLLRFDEADALTDRFMYGPSVDQILASEEVASTSAVGDILWALTDHLGTVRDLAEYDSSTDTTTIDNHLAYDAFGNITSEMNSAVDFLFGFTSRERDEESGLQFNRGRYYDALTGRWLNQDPLGFNAEDENLYRYLANSPLQRTDPSGLLPFEEDPSEPYFPDVPHQNPPPKTPNVNPNAAPTGWSVKSDTAKMTWQSYGPRYNKGDKTDVRTHKAFLEVTYWALEGKGVSEPELRKVDTTLHRLGEMPIGFSLTFGPVSAGVDTRFEVFTTTITKARREKGCNLIEHRVYWIAAHVVEWDAKIKIGPKIKAAPSPDGLRSDLVPSNDTKEFDPYLPC